MFPVDKVWASSPFITSSIRLRRLAASTFVSCSWELQTKCPSTLFFLFGSTNNVKSKSTVLTRVVCIRVIPQWQEPLLSKTTKETHQWGTLGQGFLHYCEHTHCSLFWLGVTSSCWQKYSPEHQMCINPLQKIVPTNAPLSPVRETLAKSRYQDFLNNDTIYLFTVS